MDYLNWSHRGYFFALVFVSGRFEKAKPFRSILFVFFIASFVNVVTWYFAVLVRDNMFDLLGISTATIPGMTAAKLSGTILAVGTILVLVKLSGDGLASVYIKRGNLNWAMRIGFLALLNLTATAFIIASFMDRDIESIIPNLPWFIVFALANGFMEELWFRGLFLGRLQPLVGESGAIWMTSIWFGILHILAVYVSGIAALIFGVVAFTLGFAFALLMQKTRTIWGASLFHAAADLHWFIAFGF